LAELRERQKQRRMSEVKKSFFFGLMVMTMMTGGVEAHFLLNYFGVFKEKHVCGMHAKIEKFKQIY
jgi:hypothetical protein